ncbi:Signal transduction histidine kinase [Bacillus sp. OV194]|nr:Signal transduction histidine kinase [Bacillus sp. OV194]
MNRHENKALNMLLHTLGFFGILGLLFLCWSGFFYLTPFLYKGMGYHPSSLLVYLTGSVLGLLFFGVIAHLIGRKQRRSGMNIFNLMNDAVKQIAQGDFSVSIRTEMRKGHVIADLADNINVMAKELQSLETMRQEFISNVSHEIQSPLTSIRGFAKVLQNDKLEPEDRKHYLYIIEKESKRLSKLSDNLLKLTSLESDRHPVEKVDYELDVQLKHAILSCEPSLVDKGIELQHSLEKVNVTGDQDLLNQVWLNLLYNSIKFTPRGGMIRLILKRREGEISVSVQDNGIGISEKDQIHIFERFFKSDKSRNRASEGSGLGLSIVKKIVEMHEGRIEIESEPQKGTIFTVYLPAPVE